MTGLSGFRMSQTNPDDFLLLPENITMEPLGAWIRKGDDQWLDVASWVLRATAHAGVAGRRLSEV